MSSSIQPDRDASGKIINSTSALSSNVTSEGTLYTKVHGVRAIVPPNSSYVFEFTIPYTYCYFQGAEVMQDIIGVSQFTIDHPLYGTLEQYGYNVNQGTLKYVRESKYAAKLVQGLVIKNTYFNDTNVEQEVGVNFILHEVRSE